jgi:hypothetical protein
MPNLLSCVSKFPKLKLTFPFCQPEHGKQLLLHMRCPTFSVAKKKEKAYLSERSKDPPHNRSLPVSG